MSSRGVASPYDFDLTRTALILCELLYTDCWSRRIAEATRSHDSDLHFQINAADPVLIRLSRPLHQCSGSIGQHTPQKLGRTGEMLESTGSITIILWFSTRLCTCSRRPSEDHFRNRHFDLRQFARRSNLAPRLPAGHVDFQATPRYINKLDLSVRRPPVNACCNCICPS